MSGDIHHDARCTRDSCKTYGLNSVAVLPLRSRDKVIGVLALGSLARDALAGRLTFLEMAAEQVAIGLQNALLHQEILERAAGLEEAVAERTRELQTERDRTQAILETVSESVVVTDLDGQVLFINPSTEALTGFSRDEVLRQPLWGSWSAPTLSATWPEVQQVLRGGQAWRGEIVGCRKDGTLYTAEVTGTPLYDASAASVPVGGVWVQRDITSLKEAERLKDQFVSNVSHELRTPVSVIALSCDNLLTFYDRLDDNQRRQMLQDVHEQARLLNRLGRGDPDDLPDRRRAHLREKQAGRSGSPGPQRSGKTAADRRAALPAPYRLGTGARACQGNEVQLRQVMRNLLENATKYTPVGGKIDCTCEIRAGEPAAVPAGAPPERENPGPWWKSPIMGSASPPKICPSYLSASIGWTPRMMFRARAWACPSPGNLFCCTGDGSPSFHPRPGEHVYGVFAGCGAGSSGPGARESGAPVTGCGS